MLRSRAFSRRRLGVNDLFSGLFSLLIFGMTTTLCVVALKPSAESLLARAWVPVSCRITRSAVHVERGGNQESRIKNHEQRSSADVHYQFRFIDSAMYSGRRYSFRLLERSHSDVAAIIASLPVGTEHTCFVDPEDPLNSVMNRDLPLDSIMVGIVLLLAMIAMGLVVRYIFREIHSRAQPNAWTPPHTPTMSPVPTMLPAPITPSTPPHRTVPSSGVVATSLPPGEALSEAAEYRSLKSFVGALFIAIVLHVAVTPSFASELIAGVVRWDLLPFEAIAIAATLYSLFAFNDLLGPRVTLVLLEGGRPTPGERCRLRWRFDDASISGRSFEIALVGFEIAPPGDGDDPDCRRHAFFRETFFRSTRSPISSEGDAEFFIPVDGPPTFQAEGYGVKWVIELSGKSKGRDIESTWELCVVPKRGPVIRNCAHIHRSAEASIGTLTLALEPLRVNDQPGTLVGQASWRLNADCDGLELRFFWYVSGKSDHVFRTIEVRPLTNIEPLGTYPFAVAIPESPPAMSGELFTLTWALELVVIGGRDAVRLDLPTDTDG
ncbi:MAG: DUF3592 domain-containing protein [Deltaproteobacteria bacterium]|nr:DUF3592 domain-containing protein [Deltaproteobacteria bacterium]